MAAMRRQDETVRDALPLSVAAAAAGGRVHGADVSFTGASADSRGVRPGELFIALRGARVDGHDFLAVAHERKAAAALVDHVVDFPIPQIVVADTHLALGQIAARWRAQYNFPMIGLTGSNGKTTVKELLAAILSRCGETLATQGNFNNDIGMPLTLLRMRSTQRFAVIDPIGWTSGALLIAQDHLGSGAGDCHFLEGGGMGIDVARLRWHAQA